MASSVVHIPEAEAVRDVAAILRQVEQGIEVVIDRGDKLPVTILPPRPRFPTIGEAHEISKTFLPISLDADFAEDLEDAVETHQHEGLFGSGSV